MGPGSPSTRGTWGAGWVLGRERELADLARETARAALSTSLSSSGGGGSLKALPGAIPLVAHSCLPTGPSLWPPVVLPAVHPGA